MKKYILYIGRDRRFIAVEAITLLLILILALWSAAPLLEEWGVFLAFNSQGLSFVGSFAQENPLRPLHMLGYALLWLVGNGNSAGVAIGVALLLITRYLVVRWAVSPLFVGGNRWAVSTLAALLIAWPGLWLGRYAAAQVSSILFFMAVGCAIRLSIRQSFVWGGVCALCVALLLMSYQGLVLCLFAIPAVSLFWGDKEDKGTAIKKYVFTRVLFFVVAGVVLYGAYAVIATRFMPGVGYETALVTGSSRLLTVEGFLLHVKNAYGTAYGQDGYLLAVLLSITFLFLQGWRENIDYNKNIAQVVLAAIFIVLLLPLFSLIYVSEAHISDVERVLYPVSVAFALFCISILAWRRTGVALADSWGMSAVVVLIFSVSITVAYSARQYAKIQSSVIAQVLKNIEHEPFQFLVVRDETGLLGDVYTLLEGAGTLSDALAFYGKGIAATICTPMSTDRLHPVARRYPIPTTKRCEELPASPSGTVTLSAKMVGKEIVMTPYSVEAPPDAGAGSVEQDGHRFVDMRSKELLGVVTTNLSAYEPWGRWTDGTPFSIKFNSGLPADFRLILHTASAFGPNVGKKIEVTIGGQKHSFTGPSSDAVIKLDFKGVPKGTDILTISIPMPTKPDGGDRMLGLGLVRVEISPLP